MLITTDILKRMAPLSIEELMVLYTLYNNAKFHLHYNLPSYLFDHLMELGYITRKPHQLTKEGVKIYHQIFDIYLEEDLEEKFNEWWLTFPFTNAINRFPMTRIIRAGNKNKIKVLYYSKIKEGITPEVLLKALKNEIKLRETLSTKENAFTFMQSPQTWLNNDTYLAYMNDDLENKTPIFSTYGKELL